MARIVVVGAGLAGLACADELVAGGHDVVVVEARDRVGGRVWTRRDGFAAGQHAEGGAEFVNADHTEVLAVAASLGLALEPSRPRAGAALIDAGGRIAPYAAWDDARHGELTADLGRWHAALARLADGIDPDDPTGGDSAGSDAAAAGAERIAELDRRDAGSLLDEVGVRGVARLVAGRQLRTEHMVPPTMASLLHVAWMAARERRCRQRDPQGWEAYRVTGGTDQLATGLAARLAAADGAGDRIRLGAPVERVETSPTGVVVATSVDPTPFAGDAVVVTVPIPVLTRIAFDPPLPPELFDVDWGLGAKLSVQVARRVWNDLGRNGAVVSDRAYGELWETTVAQPGDPGIITALMSSHDGSAMAALPDAAQRVVAEIDRAFPGAAGLAGATSVTDWTNDPWALGTYAAFAPGQLCRVWPLLRRPYRRVVLAGEHTDGYAGFMEGAIRSGRRGAALALAAVSAGC